MPYCTEQEVREAIDYPSTGAPIADSVILDMIEQSEEEIENIYKTKFGNVETSGTADGDYSTTTFSDSGQSWTTDAYVGYVVWIHAGTNAGDYRNITANTATKITVSPAFSATTDGTTQYRVTKLGYKDETADGDGTKEHFIEYQPLINLNSVSIDSTSVTPSYIYQYKESGKLVLSDDAEVSSFKDNERELINLKYVFGVYPLPKAIKRLCICLAGVRTLVSQVAGTYDDFATVGLPGGFSGSKGQPYVNIQSAVRSLQREAKGIIFGNADTRMVPSYRPFTVFG